MPTDITLARAMHVLAVVHWIGGVSLVTLVLLPALRRQADAVMALAQFADLEAGFSRQAKLSVTVAGLTGFYLTHRLAAWERLLDISYWWMHAMAAIWLLFTLVLFVIEPLHQRRHRQALTAPQAGARLQLIQRLHGLLLTLSMVTVAAAVLGAHGYLNA
ncbi:putative membrane protein [Methylohalomonas lacus]|uniref:Membrane protein n=1 Tax=Methylohalomonas lacus TaxID=398773 RepID=A0AAE3HIW6_9GAMM|nr:hypothetical protein [Methylohalomonas lacus]MCS3903214.1 putative membrane protein [Methylohalomonas lacus]